MIASSVRRWRLRIRNTSQLRSTEARSCISSWRQLVGVKLNARLKKACHVVICEELVEKEQQISFFWTAQWLTVTQSTVVRTSIRSSPESKGHIVENS